MDYPTTQKQYDLFKKEAVKWQKEFGFQRYELHFERINDLGARATIYAEPIDGMATIAFCGKWDSRPTSHEIRKAAFHEILELVLWDIRQMLREIYNDDVVNTVVHKVIRSLENSVFS